MIGAFEKNCHGRFIYKVDDGFLVMDTRKGLPMIKIETLPRSINIYQPNRDLNIWFIARGL